MKNIVIVAAMVLFISGCTKKQDHEINTGNKSDSAAGMIVADTIIYNVSIINHNPDDVFGQESLSGLKREQLLNSVFDMVYEGKAIAYDHTTGEKMTPGQLEKMEKTEGFSRNNIDMIQFKEIWYLNPATTSFTKKVVSMVLGTQVFDSYHTFIANKAVLRVELIN